VEGRREGQSRRPSGVLRRLGRRRSEFMTMVLEGRREAQSGRPSSLRRSEGCGWAPQASVMEYVIVAE
jgi:hypothetical protein